MSEQFTRLFDSFDRGLISRRQLLQALGITAVIRPVSALAQGTCGGANASLPRCDKMPAKLPFEPTGWKTVLLDHFSMQVADYQKEAAYFAALMNWKIRSDDGTKVVLDIGDWGGLVIRGGYRAPAPAQPGPAAAATAGAATRGGGVAPRTAVIDSFCWGIEPWDTKKVESELKKRGLNPVADNDGKDFQSFRVKDSSGFDLRISNGNAKNRRRTPATGKVTTPAPFESTAWKTVWLDHISFQCANYKENVAFYTALLGWKPGDDEGSQNECEIGDVGGIIIRGANPAGGPIPPRINVINHIAFGITPFDPDAVKAELDKRRLDGRADTGAHGDIHVAPYKSYHTPTPNGFDLQISNVDIRTRTTR
jgi:catechol 2,3-dioxygenase-like lactoylglutathione lyase family enzyme